jgi:hypothetical protein
MKNSKMDEKILETEYPELEYEDLLDEDKELIFLNYLYIGLHFFLGIFCMSCAVWLALK